MEGTIFLKPKKNNDNGSNLDPMLNNIDRGIDEKAFNNGLNPSETPDSQPEVDTLGTDELSKEETLGENIDTPSEVENSENIEPKDNESSDPIDNQETPKQLDGVLPSDDENKFYKIERHWMLFINQVWYWVFAYIMIYAVQQITISMVQTLYKKEVGPILMFINDLWTWLTFFVIIIAIVHVIINTMSFLMKKYYVGKSVIMIKNMNKITYFQIALNSTEIIQSKFGFDRILGYGTVRVVNANSGKTFSFTYVVNPRKVLTYLKQKSGNIDMINTVTNQKILEDI